MANTSIDISTGFYVSDSLPLANQRCVNLYPNFPQAPSLKQGTLFEVEGILAVETTSDFAVDANRGSWEFQGVPYFVNGGFLWRLNRRVGFRGVVSYEKEFLGTVDGGIAPVSMADNGRQLLIINGDGEGYVFQPGATPQFQPIVDLGFYANGTPEKVVFVDSYFVVSTDSKKALISAPNDGLDWNSIDTISAEADPDEVVAPFKFKNQLYLLGSQTTESYQNIGGAGVPFRRINGFVLSRGCSAAGTVQQLGEQVLWVGAGENELPAVWQFTGNEPTKVSTTAVDNQIQALNEEQLKAMYSWAYSIRGHEFVAFCSSEWCFVYDTTTGKWFERESEIPLGNGARRTIPCRIRSVVTAYNLLFVGDTQDGRIGQIDAECHAEYNEYLISYFTTSPLYTMGNSFTLPSIELLCESGVGNANSPDPEVRLEISRDGVVFEDAIPMPLGKIGDRQRRQIWLRNGRFDRMAVMKFTISSPVKRRLYGIELKYKQTING